GSRATISMSSGCRRRSSSACSRSASPGSTALARAVLFLLACSAPLAAGCGSGGGSMLVRERFEAVQAPHRIAGTTSRAGRVVYTASIACGGSSYLQPMVPLANDLGFVNAFTVLRNGRPFDFILPHLAAGISSHGEATRSLACPR